MYLSIRDDVVFAAGYESLAAGLRDLGIAGVELFVKRDDTVSALVPSPEKPRLSLSDPAELAELRRQADVNGLRISALCMANNFNSEDKEFEIA